MDTLADLREGTILIPRGGGDRYCVITFVIDDKISGYTLYNVKSLYYNTRAHRTADEILSMYKPNNDPAMRILFGIDTALPKGTEPVGESSED